MEKRGRELESLKTMAVYMLQQSNSLGLKTTSYMLSMIITDLEQIAIDETFNIARMGKSSEKPKGQK